MTHWFYNVWQWLEHRLQLRDSLWPVLRHPVPRGLGWWYVFGSSTMTLFLLQVATGICLTFVYVPSAGEAYASLEYMNYGAFWGWLLRAIHFWSASGMVVMMALHMIRVFLFGAFKYPRELTWLVGVGLLVLTLGLAFTGQVLRWDTDAYWGVGIGVSIMGRIPVVGPGLARLVMGGPEVTGDTLSRFFSLHVFWLPGLLGLFLAVHLYLVIKLGISTRPVPGKLVEPATEEIEYAATLKRGEPFFPYDISKDAVFASLTVLTVLLLALVFGPMGPSESPDPTQIHTEPRPDWEFRWLFALLALSPAWLESVLMLGLPALLLLVLVLVPFVSRRGERAPSRRPVAVLAVVLTCVTFGVLTWLGYTAPWSPDMQAWSRDPVPVHLVKAYSPRQLQGAVVFQYKSCRNCHSLEGVGGRKGPDLTAVATRLTPDELVRQVIQGGGDMPAYGKQLSRDEVEALVGFLQTLRPAGEAAARPTGEVKRAAP